ncbi:hypothetical protein GON03_21385 [Nocardioides sp. MAH-18]|uniref:Polymerase nucleotidyl transferase domain-containing protein n=1 Tax=Nocardioides agri TaxID=2682843 RepID=A0A6L6XWY4_9ACTN|nr:MULTISPECIES: nucleotidyltransferase domain-containing protein [unclassified Nocardioides]MBA2952577.1 nucleotidyltransferase domain-containing protein [Nocardioides sp. CGMCC 1.13656]MVQ51739.1 hypothetical protein [Nocardioides sp. MAH-18]
MHDDRLRATPAVADLDASLPATVVGLYVGGSVATGDYRPAISDIDAVALLDAPVRRPARAQLVALHQRLGREHPEGGALHCVYVPREQSADPDRRHWTWAEGELFRRPLSRIGRAELLADPVVVRGPAPATWLPPATGHDVRDAALAELSGYWTRALRKRAIWRQDLYVDLGLTVWARAEAAIEDGVLITKTEAIARMSGRGLPADIVDGVRRRRAGDRVELSKAQREERAVVVRSFLRAEVARLLATR